MKKPKPGISDPLYPLIRALHSAVKTELARLHKNTREEAKYYKETCDNLENALDQWASAKPKKKP